MARLLLRRLTPSALAPSSSSSSCAFLPTARNFDHGPLTSAQRFRCFSTADEVRLFLLFLHIFQHFELKRKEVVYQKCLSSSSFSPFSHERGDRPCFDLPLCYILILFCVRRFFITNSEVIDRFHSWKTVIWGDPNLRR
jgi:hypothetical protein